MNVRVGDMFWAEPSQDPGPRVVVGTNPFNEGDLLLLGPDGTLSWTAWAVWRQWKLIPAEDR